MTYYVGVDIGTSSVKLRLIDAQGNVCAKQAETYSLSQPQPGWLEIDPNKWFSATMKGFSKLLEGADRNSVRGIGFTGQMHTTVFLDKNVCSIRPAISWNDIRTADTVEWLKGEISRYKELHHIEKILSTGSPAANLLWIKRNEPAYFASLETILIGSDYLTFRFSGHCGTDYCEASTSSLFDIYNKAWSPRMCQIIGIPESVLPTVYKAGQIAGSILPDIAEQLGLSQEVQIITGTGDNPAAYMSSGQLCSGEPMISLGTSGILMFSKDRETSCTKGKPILFSVDNTNFHIIVQGAVQSTGSTFRWWAEDILQNENYDAISGLVDCSKPVNKQLLFYPHLTGDKTIHADPHLKGAFIGIGTDSTREEITRAIMEGIGFAFRQLMEKMYIGKEPHTIKVTGGMSCMESFMQILADILHVNIDVSVNIGAAHGIALLAAQSCGIEGVFNCRNEHAKSDSIFHPRSAFVDMYNEKYYIYTRIYDSLKQIYT